MVDNETQLVCLNVLLIATTYLFKLRLLLSIDDLYRTTSEKTSKLAKTLFCTLYNQVGKPTNDKEKDNSKAVDKFLCTIPTFEERTEILFNVINESLQILDGSLIPSETYKKHWTALSGARRDPGSKKSIQIYKDLLEDVPESRKECLVPVIQLWGYMAKQRGSRGIEEMAQLQYRQILGRESNQMAQHNLRHVTDRVALNTVLSFLKYSTLIFGTDTIEEQNIQDETPELESFENSHQTPKQNKLSRTTNLKHEAYQSQSSSLVETDMDSCSCTTSRHEEDQMSDSVSVNTYRTNQTEFNEATQTDFESEVEFDCNVCRSSFEPYVEKSDNRLNYLIVGASVCVAIGFALFRR